jgi:hypothetical protein
MKQRDTVVTKIKLPFGEIWFTSSGREPTQEELHTLVANHEPKLVDHLPNDPLIVSLGYLAPPE